QLLRLSVLQAFVMRSSIGRVGPELIRIASRESADLFIGHNLAGLPAAVLAAQRHHTRAAFDAEDLHSAMWLYETGPSSVDRLAQEVEQRFLPQCAYVIASSSLI